MHSSCVLHLSKKGFLRKVSALFSLDAQFFTCAGVLCFLVCFLISSLSLCHPQTSVSNRPHPISPCQCSFDSQCLGIVFCQVHVVEHLKLQFLFIVFLFRCLDDVQLGFDMLGAFCSSGAEKLKQKMCHQNSVEVFRVLISSVGSDQSTADLSSASSLSSPVVHLLGHHVDCALLISHPNV